MSLMTQQPSVILALEQVDLSFTGSSVLKQLSFAMLEGEICALIGPNGAGKSSVMNIIHGIYRPQAGRVILAGQSHKAMDARQFAALGLARTYQNLALFKQMSVLDNLLVACARQAHYRWYDTLFATPRYAQLQRQHLQWVEQVLQMLDLQQWRTQRVSELPYGVQKTVELARAVVSKPKLMLLDEPMAGMTPPEKQRIAKFIQRLNRDMGISIFMIEHDLAVVMQLSQHVVVLDYGKKIADGTPQQIQQHPEVFNAYLGVTKTAAFTPAAWEAAG